MDRQEEYSKVRNESVVRLIHELCLDNTDAHQVVFNDLFKEAYNLGKKHAREEVVTKDNQLRLQVATAAMKGILANTNIIMSCGCLEDNQEYITKHAVMYADALIEEINGKGGSNERK